MDFIIELVLELFFELGVDASKSRKTPKFIRYILVTIISLFFISVIGLILFMGLTIMKENMLGGFLIFLFGIFMLITSIIKFRKTYLNKAEKIK